MQSEATERLKIDQVSVESRSILAQALAGQIALTDEGVHLGIMGCAGSGRSTLIQSICEHLLKGEPDAWVVVPFDASTNTSTNASAQTSAQNYVKQSSEAVALIGRTLTHSLLRGSKPYFLSGGPVAFFTGLFSELSLLIRFALAVRFHVCMALLLAVALFIALFSIYSWEAISRLPMHSASLLEIGGLLVLLGLFVLILRLMYELLHLSPDAMTLSELEAFFRLKSKPLLGCRKRILVVATGFHSCSLAELPRLLESLHAILSSTQASIIYELESSVTLATFAAEYQAIGRYQRSILVQHSARERLSRLIELPVDLDLLFSGWSQSKSLQRKAQADKLSEDQIDRFNKWCVYFEFNNPRQQIRLLRSYQLLLKLYGEEESISKGDNRTLDSLTADITCPMLITLCALEYVNSFDDQRARAELLAWLSRVRQRGFAEETEKTLAEIDVEGKLSEEIVAIVNRCSEIIKPFVLPALQLPGADSAWS